jgi:hypothetical protein
METDWNAFFAGESLNLNDEQWTDLATTVGPSAMPSSSGNPRAAGTATSGLSNFDDILNQGPDGYITDAFYNPGEFFPSDLDILNQFPENLGGEVTTPDSSPESTTALAYGGHTVFRRQPELSSSSQTPASTTPGSNQSPTMAAPSSSLALSRAQDRANVYSNSSYAPMFPSGISVGDIEDLTFPDGPTGLPSTAKTAKESNTEVDLNPTAKRNKGKPDILSACWTSPLCPNHDQDGPPPNPSNCGAGCAPFLFSSSNGLSTSTIDKNIMTGYASPEELEEFPEGVVEIQSRPKKRTEADTSATEPNGRKYSLPRKARALNKVAAPATIKESESTPNSPELPQDADDGKPKPRRRQPHNQVERKYRESLNTQLTTLSKVVPSLQQNGCDGADIEDLPTPSKPSKAVILASATAYIKQLEKERKALADENAILHARIKGLSALIKCEDCSLMQYFVDLKINPPQ